jgi:hypothetical protein
VTGSGGSGIVVGIGCDYSGVLLNVVSTSETNGILLAQGYDGVNCGGYWGYNEYEEYGYHYGCEDYISDSVGVFVYANTISGSGSEGIDNGGQYTTIANNIVTGSGIYDFANGGSVNASASTGNSPSVDWETAPAPRQLDYGFEE